MRHASIFSGIGGPEIAATMLGWENVFHCDINDFCNKILEYWFPNATSYGNIFETNFTSWRGKVDILSGGFPCQPFSTAGKRRGSDDNRYLWPQMLRVISEVQPTWVVAENVAGILSMVEPGEITSVANQTSLFDKGEGVQRYRQEQPFTIQRICSDIESLGYEVQPLLIPACAVGAPHRRDRIYIIATSSNTSYMQFNGSEFGGRGYDIRQTLSEFGSGDCKATEKRTTTDSNSNRGCKGNEHIQSQFPNGTKPERSCGKSASTNTSCNLGRGIQYKVKSERTQSSDVLSRIFCGLSYKVGQRWENFPTISPIHRGNDGLPFNVDDIAIPFTKWRTESLKAYGNAIVPQVIYEIFRAIEIVSEQSK